MMTGDENDHRALNDLLPQLKAETGIDLVISAPALAALIDKTAQDLAAPQSPFDLIEYLGFLTTSYMSAGRFLQLNDLLDDPAETPPDWDFAGLHPTQRQQRRHLRPGHQGRSVWATRSSASRACTAARSSTSIARTCSTRPASSRPSHLGRVQGGRREAQHADDVAGCSFIGANDFSLATVDWYTRFITTGGVLMTGSPQTKNFKPQLNSRGGRCAADAHRPAALRAEERRPRTASPRTSTVSRRARSRR